MTDWATQWHAISTAALLGTERRSVQVHVDGAESTVLAVRDVVLDAETHRPVPQRGEPDPARRTVRMLAAATVAQRAGMVSRAAIDPLVLAVPDRRPVISSAVVRLWHTILSDWPALDEEFVVRVLASGQRLAPDIVPTMLARWRGSILPHTRVRAAAGPLADWLLTVSPGLAARGRVAADADLLVLTPPTLTPDLAAAVAAVEAVETAEAGTRHLTRLVCAAAYADRIVVANAVRSLSPAGLLALLRALEPRRGDPLTPGLAPAARDLAALRRDLYDALPPAGIDQHPDTLSRAHQEGIPE